MPNVEYALFFDNHTSRFCPDTGHRFQADQFAERIREIGADLVGFHAKCNQGFCYYDTKIGTRHPSLREGHDWFGEVVEECRKRGIKVSAYFNCGPSNEDGVRHPEWCRMGKNGELFHPEVLDSMVSPYVRIMCVNSPYRDYLMSLIKEVKERYPVAGFLFDSFNAFPCYCPYCVAGMRKQGLDPAREEDVLAFAQDSVRRLGKDLSELIQPRKNGLLMYCLGLSERDNLEYGSYLECECLPTYPIWGYDMLPVKARYLRTLVKHGEPVLNMTGRFYAWGDFGSLRTAAALEYDLLYGLANGMRPNVGDHIHPSGAYHSGISSRLKEVYGKLKQYDPWFRGAVNPVDLALLKPGDGTTPSVKTATRMLSELKMQFDCIDRFADWSPYKVILLPDDVLLTEELRRKAEDFLKRGGKIIATGDSGLDPEKKAFLFEKEWGVRYLKESDFDPVYFAMPNVSGTDFPGMPLALNASCAAVKARTGTEALGAVVAPYYNRGWDGIYATFYTPPDRKTDFPFLTFTEQVAYCPGKLFLGYDAGASVELRNVLKVMLERILPEPLLTTGGTLPSFARAFVSDQPGRRMVHLLNYVPEKRGNMLIVEEELTASRVELSLRMDGRRTKRVYAAPGETDLPFEQSGDRLRFTVPEVRGYALLCAEFES